jgi:hypothetical protein
VQNSAVDIAPDGLGWNQLLADQIAFARALLQDVTSVPKPGSMAQIL